jgi:hypothetical protein
MIIQGIDYSNAIILYLNEIRTYLIDRFKVTADVELMVVGIFITARKT